MNGQVVQRFYSFSVISDRSLKIGEMGVVIFNERPY